MGDISMEFQRGGGENFLVEKENSKGRGVLFEIPFVAEIWIFSGTTHSGLYELIGLYLYILWCDSGNREYNCQPICHQQSLNILMTFDTFRIDHLSTSIPTKFHHCVCVLTCWPTPNQVLMWLIYFLAHLVIVGQYVSQHVDGLSTDMSTEY